MPAMPTMPTLSHSLMISASSSTSSFFHWGRFSVLRSACALILGHLHGRPHRRLHVDGVDVLGPLFEVGVQATQDDVDVVGDRFGIHVFGTDEGVEGSSVTGAKLHGVFE